MKTCFNDNIVYFMILFQQYCKNCKKNLIRGLDFDSLEFADKKDYLKSAFEMKACELYNYMEKTFSTCKPVSEMSDGEKADFEKWKKAFVIAESIFCAVLNSKKLDGGRVIRFNCFLHDDKVPSMNYMPSVHGFHCFGCCHNGEIIDIFNLVDLMSQWAGKGSLNFFQQMSGACEMLVDTSDGWKIKSIFSSGTENNIHSDFIPYTKEMNLVRHNKYYNFKNAENDPKAIEYLNSRGISAKTAKRLAVMVQYPTDRGGQSWGRGYLAFINSDGGFVRRLFMEDKVLSQYCPWPANKWWNKKDCPAGIFNGQVITHCRQFGQVCFVCEGAFDALTCEEMGFHAIALNSADNAKGFVGAVDKRNLVKYCCLSDNDPAGLLMASEFQKAGLYVPDYFKEKTDTIFCKYKDINDCFVADKNTTYNAMCELEKKVNAFYGF